jgi:hypothetical protein
VKSHSKLEKKILLFYLLCSNIRVPKPCKLVFLFPKNVGIEPLSTKATSLGHYHEKIVACCLRNATSKFTRVSDWAKTFIGQSLLHSQVQLFKTSLSQLFAPLILVKCLLSFVGCELTSTLARAALKTDWSKSKSKSHCD